MDDVNSKVTARLSGSVHRHNTYDDIDEMDISDLSGVKPFESQAELIAAMQTPEYRRGDKTFHRMVARRLAAGNR